MKSARATATFAAALATVSSITILESRSARPAVWIALACVTVVASIAFGIASRKSTYAWYSAPAAGIATIILSGTLHNWLIQFGRAASLTATLAVLVFVPIVLARALAEQKSRNTASPQP